MAKTKSRTTALPARNVRDGRKYRSRSEREAQSNRIILMVAGILALVIVLILGGALAIEYVITPNQPVAVFGGWGGFNQKFLPPAKIVQLARGSFFLVLHMQCSTTTNTS